MRLQKYIAAAGVCSRREAEEYIRQGRVTVNGVTASLGSGAEEGDVVLLNGKRLSLPEEHTYVLLHKPRGYVTTLRDTHGRPTVAELVQDAGVRLSRSVDSTACRKDCCSSPMTARWRIVWRIRRTA